MYRLVIQEDTRKGWFCRTRYAVLAFKNTSTAGSKNNPKSMMAGLWQWSSWDRLRRPDTCIADNNGLSLCWMWKRSSYCFLHSYREPERQVFMYYLLCLSPCQVSCFHWYADFFQRIKITLTWHSEAFDATPLSFKMFDTCIRIKVGSVFMTEWQWQWDEKKTNPPQEIMIPV